MQVNPFTTLYAPHQTVAAANETELFALQLLDALWGRYRQRMEYVRKYEQMITEHNGTFINDHIAFRTIASQKPAAGIFSISRIFETLGYKPADCYNFPDKKLSATYFQHPNPRFPKLFISQLNLWELSAASQKCLMRSLRSHRAPIDLTLLNDLQKLNDLGESEKNKLQKELNKFFYTLPWPLPQKKDVLAVNAESQYGAWVLVNGYEVNHFTASISARDVATLNDIEKVVSAMNAAGIPMKKEIEGAAGSKLRQSSTEAVTLSINVREGKNKTQMPWSYAYFEIAERPELLNPDTGKLERYEGFLGSQATNLFNMTEHRRGNG